MPEGRRHAGPDPGDPGAGAERVAGRRRRSWGEARRDGRAGPAADGGQRAGPSSARRSPATCSGWRSLRESPGARFEVEGTELGDLDHDGKADAAVLLNYQSDQPGTSQFLVVYRFDGKTFVPAAKTYVGGVGTDVLASGIEKIEDGTIHLLLEVRQPGDLECCPSGHRSESYVLQNGALVALRSES